MSSKSPRTPRSSSLSSSRAATHASTRTTSEPSRPGKPLAKTAPAQVEAREPNHDVVLVHGISETGEMAVLRARNQQFEAGLMRPVREGEIPSDGELVKLKPRPESPLLCDVEVQVPKGTLNARGATDGAPALKGPPQIATQAYRANWDAIWERRGAGKAKAKPN